MGPAKRAATQQVNWRIDSDALDLLGQLETASHRRGQYVSALIRKAGHEAGLGGQATPDPLALLQQQVRDLQRRVDAVEGRTQGD